MLKYIVFAFSLLFLSLILWLKFNQTHAVISLPASALLTQSAVPDFIQPPQLPPISLRTVFADDHTWTATLSAEKTITLLATGDVLTARTVNRKTHDYKDFTWAWQKTADELRKADVTFINLETPLVTNCPIKEGGFVFCGSPEHVSGLKFAGIDVVNLANNHMGNYGQAGVGETVSVLENVGMKLSGVTNRATEIMAVKGTRIAFLGYNEVDVQIGVNQSEKNLIQKQIFEAKEMADLVIVQFHWGNEYTHSPSTHQQELAHWSIDNGADLIIGNHPHWWQPPEIYKGKYITYSHGNFIFDQMWSYETREGLVGKYTFYEGTLVDVEYLPILIEDYGQPDWIGGEEKMKVLKKLEKETVT